MYPRLLFPATACMASPLTLSSAYPGKGSQAVSIPVCLQSLSILLLYQCHSTFKQGDSCNKRKTLTNIYHSEGKRILTQLYWGCGSHQLLLITIHTLSLSQESSSILPGQVHLRMIFRFFWGICSGDFPPQDQVTLQRICSEGSAVNGSGNVIRKLLVASLRNPLLCHVFWLVSSSAFSVIWMFDVFLNSCRQKKHAYFKI